MLMLETFDWGSPEMNYRSPYVWFIVKTVVQIIPCEIESSEVDGAARELLVIMLVSSVDRLSKVASDAIEVGMIKPM